MRFKKLSIYIMCGLLSGCDSSRDVRTIVAQIKSTTPAAIEKLPDLKEYVPVTYTASNVSDPFSPSFTQNISNKNMVAPALKSQAKRPDFDRPREYLENFPLDTLLMVGTLQRKSENWALVVDRSGILHKVKAGNYLGQNSGKITKVNEEDLEIEEIISDEQGGWTNRNASIKIKHK